MSLHHPFSVRYPGGNYLSVASYGSLLAGFLSAVTHKLKLDGYSGYAFTLHFKNLLFVTWLLPYIVAFADMANVPQHFMTIISHCRRRCCVGSSSAANERKAKLRPANVMARDEASYIKNVDAAFTSDNKRGLYILSTFKSMLPVVGDVVCAAGVYAEHVRKSSQYRTSSDTKPTWDEDKDGATTLSVAKELTSLLHSMIDAFSNGGKGDRADGGGGEDDTGRASSLTGNYRPLYWRHFIEVEESAHKLSEIAFPFTSLCHAKAQSAEKGKPGFVRKSFAKRNLLWSKPITEQLQRVQAESRRASAASRIFSSERKAEAADADGSNSISDSAHPNMHDIR